MMSSGDSDSAQEAPSPTLLLDHLLATNPQAIVLIGCAQEDLYWPDNRDESQLVMRFDSLETAVEAVKNNLPSDEHEDEREQIAVFNAGSDESMLTQNIGTAVRAFPNRLIVYSAAHSAPDTLFFALGFRKLNVVESTSGDLDNRWYEFRLSHYKQSPDWLNNRFWANPERFNLDDDPDIYFDPDGSDEEE